MKRRYFLLLASGAAAFSLSGCSWWNGLTMRSQSPEEPQPEESKVKLVGDFAVPTGMQPQGLPQTVTKPVVTIGGIPATVSFSGLASCCVGLNQVNVRVPSGTPAGNAVPVVLTIGGVQANTVTIAVSGP